jgi:paraquat-inducible protein A
MAPTLRLGGLAWVMANLTRRQPPLHLARLFRWVEWLKPWSMVEVFLLGVFVAYTKLVDLARVDVGPAAYALGGLMLITAAIDNSLDPEAVWRRIDRRDRGLTPAGRAGPGAVLACDACQLVNAAGQDHCARCGGRLHRRKPDSLSRTWALLLAAAVLYVPANVFPVLTLVRLGRGAPSTILGGVRELAIAGMWPLAALVLFASILVPVLKLLSLSFLLISVRRRSTWRPRLRTQLYRIIEFIGRWSMIDVFMISILTALVRMGRLASVYPGPGVLAFCSVVILTMLASASFDPRLIWDAAERPR